MSKPYAARPGGPDPRATLTESIVVLAKQARALGVSNGAQRLELVNEHLERLAPEIAFQWIDPVAFKREMEEARSRQSDWIHVLRNALALGPLLLTWLALSLATIAYQNDLNTYPSDRDIPFLKLWQDGFHGSTPLTFAFTGITDFVMLFAILALTVWSYLIERRAAADTDVVAGHLQAVTGTLIRLVDTNGLIKISPEASVSDVANAVQIVINRAMQASQQVVDRALGSIEQTVQRSDDLYRGQVMPLMSQFRTDMASLHTELSNYQHRLDDLTGASAQLGGAASSLADNAGAYTTAATTIRDQVSALNTTQQALVREISGVGTGISRAATSVEGVARELSTGMRTDIEAMTANITRAAETLRQVELQLQVTTLQMQRATATLANVDIIGGGLLGWLIKRRANRRKAAGNGAPA